MELDDAARELARAGGGGGSDAGPDRLSALPDCLLHVIMSSLKARQAVQTCVLSTRWRHLWRSVPCLDVDQDEFSADPAARALDRDASSGGDDSSDSRDGSLDYADGSSDSDNEGSDDLDEDSSSESDTDSSSSSTSSDDDGDKDKEWEVFEDFTANLMRRCNIAQLDSFRLNIVSGRAPEFANRQGAGWFRRAMKYCTPDPAGHRERSSPTSWRLKRLHLCHVLLDNRFVKHVSLVCRSLEDLELVNCTCEIQSITSLSLKTLVLKNCRWRNLSEITSPSLKTLVIDGGSNTNGCALVILAPAVAYLELDVIVDRFCGGISINEMPSLAKASIHLRGHRNSVFESKLCGDQFKLLCSVSNVTSLEFSGVGTTVVSKDCTFHEFKNLRNLMLGNCDLRDDFCTLGFFLQRSPNLKNLTLRHCKFPNNLKKKKGTSKPDKTSSSQCRGLDFLCDNLKVEVIYKDGDAQQLVKLLLRFSGILSEDYIKLTKVN